MGNELPSFQLVPDACERALPGKVKNGKANLVVADPPYNFGMDYADHNDKQPPAVYLTWTQLWLRKAYDALHEHGAMWLFYPDEWVSEVDLFCRKELELTRRNWVTWIFTFGQAAKKSFTRSHVHILYYVKHKKHFTFNRDKLLVPSARQLVYNDKRAMKGGKLPDDTWALLKQDLELALPNDGDVWSHSRVCGTYKARDKKSPNQIPTDLLDRIMRACTNPGDLVVDPFNGTGSTGESALKHGCHYIGIDKSKSCIASSQKRLAKAVVAFETASTVVTKGRKRK